MGVTDCDCALPGDTPVACAGAPPRGTARHSTTITALSKWSSFSILLHLTSVPRILPEIRIEIDLPLRNRQENVRRLDSNLRDWILAQYTIEKPPPLEIEQTLRLELELPAPLLTHRITKSRLRQSC